MAEKKPTSETKKPTKKAEELILDPRKEYVIEGTGKSAHLKKGGEYKVSGEIAGILIKKGSAKLK